MSDDTKPSMPAKPAPRVSVVMSVFNDEEFLGESVDSLLDQTFGDFELVVINDGSTDASARILRQYVERDERVQVIEQANQGLTRSLITGCDRARGRYIARQDGDDWSHPQRLQKQWEALEANPQWAFVSCWAEGITKEGIVLDKVQRDPDPKQATHDLRFNRQGPPAHGTVMFRRDAYEQVGGYHREFYFSQDSDLWLRMAEVGQIGYLPEVLYRYRRDAESLSSIRHDVQYEFGEFGQACHSVRANGGDESDLLAQAAELTASIVAGALDGKVNPERVAATQYLIGSQLALNGDPSARNYLWPVLQRRPWHVKAWIRLLQSWV